MSGVFCVFKKIVSLTCISGLLVTMNLPLFSAYEAHVINVTAKIENDVPSIDPPGGEFCDDGELEVTLSTTLVDPNTSIIYTTDGSDPDCFIPNGIVYTGTPFPLTYSATVKARVCHYRDGELLQSIIMSEYYDVSSVYCDVVCGPCEGKIINLTLKYNGSQPDLIRVVQKKDNVVVFEGVVNPGEQFSFSGTWGTHPTLGTEIIIYVDVNGIENTNIHTSCSELVEPNMVFGDFTIIAGESSGGGALCPMLGDIVLNEFLPNPDGDDNASMPDGEWVELYNNNSFDMDVAGWYLYDNNDSQSLEITLSNSDNNNNILDAGETIVPAHGWLVVYMNGEYNDWLNNTGGDSVRLYNDEIGIGILIDSYTYVSDALSGKSYARIPDGTGSWVDPIPTPGTPNVLEDPLVAPSVSTSDVVDVTDVDAIGIDAGDSSSDDNISDSAVDSDSGVISDAASEDIDSGAGDEARDENLDDLLGDVVDSEEDPDAIPEDDEGLDTALEDEEDLDATVDEEEDPTAVEPEEEDPLLVDGAINNEEDEAGINDETSDTSEENPLPVDDVVNNEEDEMENVNNSGTDSTDNVSGSTDKDTVDTVDGVGDSDAGSDEAEKIGGSINGGVESEVGGDAVSVDSVDTVDAVDMDAVDNTIETVDNIDNADPSVGSVDPADPADFADSDDSVIEFSL